MGRIGWIGRIVALVLLVCVGVGAETWEHKNFSGFVDLPFVKDGDTFRLCNFTQPEFRPILKGRKGLKFELCNLTDALPPPGSDLSSGDNLLCRTVLTPVVTLRKEDAEAQLAAEREAAELAVKQAETATITVRQGMTVAEAVAAAEAKRVQVVEAAVTAARRGAVDISGLTPQDNGDGTISYCRKSYERVEMEK